MVVGINLVHVPVPSAPYELLLAELVDEYAAQGNTVVTVVVLNQDGVQTAERAFMAWPFPTLDAANHQPAPAIPRISLPPRRHSLLTSSGRWPSMSVTRTATC